MLNKSGLIALIIFFSFPGISLAKTAGDAEKLKNFAQKYYWGKTVKQDYSKALQLYLEAAELGDTEAQYIAGGMYYKGFGVKKNNKKAFDLLYGAAISGNSTPQSQKLIGQFFLTGSSVPKNYAEAKKWYKLAAENGDRDAQSELAFLYYTGRGGEQDLKKSFSWYKKSAEQGLAVAQYSLGIMYFSGSGVPSPDLVKAYSWINMAASQNHSDAKIVRDSIEQLLSSDELKKAQNFTLQLYKNIN